MYEGTPRYRQLHSHGKEPDFVPGVEGKIHRLYQVVSEEFHHDVTDTVIGYFMHTFADVSFEGNKINFRYHKRGYEADLVDNCEGVCETRGIPPTVIKGSLDVVVKFPNENKSNRRLVRRIQRELEVPYDHVDRSGM